MVYACIGGGYPATSRTVLVVTPTMETLKTFKAGAATAAASSLVLLVAVLYHGERCFTVPVPIGAKNAKV